MVSTVNQLKRLTTEHGSECVYSITERRINVFAPRNTGSLIGTVPINDRQIDYLLSGGYSDNRSYPIGYFIIALATLEAPKEEAADVSEAV